jgi:hypothetical protein
MFLIFQKLQAIIEAALGIEPVEGFSTEVGITSTACCPGYIMTG